MGTTVSREITFLDDGHDDWIETNCHYEFQSTADIFSFHCRTIHGGVVFQDNYLMSPLKADYLLHAIVAAQGGKMGSRLGNPYTDNVFSKEIE